jgi:hypothetical protein
MDSKAYYEYLGASQAADDRRAAYHEALFRAAQLEQTVSGIGVDDLPYTREYLAEVLGLPRATGRKALVRAALESPVAPTLRGAFPAFLKPSSAPRKGAGGRRGRPGAGVPPQTWATAPHAAIFHPLARTPSRKRPPCRRVASAQHRSP